MTRDTKPSDLLRLSSSRASAELINARLETCKECEFFRDRFKKCSICGCIMPLKVSLVDSKCPEDKWAE